MRATYFNVCIKQMSTTVSTTAVSALDLEHMTSSMQTHPWQLAIASLVHHDCKIESVYARKQWVATHVCIGAYDSCTPYSLTYSVAWAE